MPDLSRDERLPLAVAPPEPVSLSPAVPGTLPDVAIGPCWRMEPLVRLCWRCVDEEADGWLVYDAGSGQTHALEPLAAAVLGLIEEQPLTPRALELTLAAQLAGAEALRGLTGLLPGASDLPSLDDDQRLALQHTLGHLQTAGLVGLG